MRMKVKARGGLNVYSEPSERSFIVKVLRDGKEIDVSRIERGWAKVRGGFCLVRYLVDTEEEEPLVQPDELTEVKVQAGRGISLADFVELVEPISRIVDD